MSTKPRTRTSTKETESEDDIHVLCNARINKIARFKSSKFPKEKYVTTAEFIKEIERIEKFLKEMHKAGTQTVIKRSQAMAVIINLVELDGINLDLEGKIFLKNKMIEGEIFEKIETAREISLLLKESFHNQMDFEEHNNRRKKLKHPELITPAIRMLGKNMPKVQTRNGQHSFELTKDMAMSLPNDQLVSIKVTVSKGYDDTRNSVYFKVVECPSAFDLLKKYDGIETFVNDEKLRIPLIAHQSMKSLLEVSVKVSSMPLSGFEKFKPIKMVSLTLKSINNPNPEIVDVIAKLSRQLELDI
jgi:hypothetical protein